MMMNKEIECEIEVYDLKEVETRLKEQGSTLLETFRMKDTYFDKDQFYRNIRIRLRKKEITYPQKNTVAIYTEKSPSIKDGIQTADEKEMDVDYNECYNRLIKKGIAYESILDVKRYGLKNSTIELRDTGLTHYVEIESPTKKELEETLKTLNIKGRVLKEGALNRSLELKGLPKIKV